MNILVVNDDGIHSAGIWPLAEAMARVGNVLIVAPDKEQSGMGSSMTLRTETAICEIPSPVPGTRAYSVGGTPSDCASVGIRRLRQERTDLLVSGINTGPNVGRDIPYSGTVMATLQGYFRQIPSVAVSLVPREGGETLRFDVAARVAESLVRCIQAGKVPTGGILNVNVPNLPLDQIKGIRVTRAAPSGYIRSPQPTPIGMRYSMGRSKHVTAEQLEGTDISAVDAGYVSITPLRFEVTHHDLIPSITECMAGVEGEWLGRGG